MLDLIYTESRRGKEMAIERTPRKARRNFCRESLLLLSEKRVCANKWFSDILYLMLFEVIYEHRPIWFGKCGCLESHSCIALISCFLISGSGGSCLSIRFCCAGVGGNNVMICWNNKRIDNTLLFSYTRMRGSRDSQARGRSNSIVGAKTARSLSQRCNFYLRVNAWIGSTLVDSVYLPSDTKFYLSFTFAPLLSEPIKTALNHLSLQFKPSYFPHFNEQIFCLKFANTNPSDYWSLHRF